jgi:hypothetical protein
MVHQLAVHVEVAGRRCTATTTPELGNVEIATTATAIGVLEPEFKD